MMKIYHSRGINEIDHSSWNSCVASNAPFLSHAYLSAVESSGIASKEAGWHPLHMAVNDDQDRLIGAIPLYLRYNSYNDHWNDVHWALGYHQVGGRYYPKLMAGIPFIPVSGPRLLLHPSAPPGTAEVMIATLEKFARDHQLSSIYVVFPDDADCQRLRKAGWLSQHTIQYEWLNQGYRDFADYLDAFDSKTRWKIKHERRQVAESRVEFRDIPGSDVTDADIGNLVRLLDSIHDRRNTLQPLSAAFLRRFADGFGERFILTFAEERGVPIGALITIDDGERFYIRNWGCVPGHKFLHFETCYYRTIEKAIAQKYRGIHGGHGGPHKLARGFVPHLAHSLHWFRHDNLKQAVAQEIAQKTPAVMELFKQQMASLPFRRSA